MLIDFTISARNVEIEPTGYHVVEVTLTGVDFSRSSIPLKDFISGFTVGEILDCIGETDVVQYAKDSGWLDDSDE